VGLREGLAFGTRRDASTRIKKNDGLMEAIATVCPAKHFPFSGAGRAVGMFAKIRRPLTSYAWRRLLPLLPRTTTGKAFDGQDENPALNACSTASLVPN
jgi:hypothetical protein